MTVEELKERKIRLEIDIQNFMSNFTKENKVEINNIILNKELHIFHPYEYHVKIGLDL